MKKLILAGALLLAACGSGASSTGTAAATAPQSLMQQAQAKAPEDQPVFAYTVLAAYQGAHPDSTPKCERVRGAQSVGVIPADVAAGSIYQPYVGDLVFSVQCGPQLTTVAPDPHQHWLVIMAPTAADATVVTCADAHGNDACPIRVPRATATSTSTTTTTHS
jgi:hypothetical protein